MKKEKSYRVDWIDNAKSIGIFLVVFGHLSNPVEIRNFIYSFHMPLFFFLSGLTFKAYIESSIFVSKKIRSIIIPYFTFGVLTYVFWLLIGRKFGTDASLDILWWKPLIGMLYSNGVDNWLIHNTPLWFLTCLFVTEMSMFFLVNKLNKALFVPSLLLISFTGFILSLYSLPRLPWAINVVPQSMLFMGLGYMFASLNNFKLSRIHLRFMFLSLVIVTAVLSLLNGYINMNGNTYGNYILFLASSVCGIGMIIALSKLLGSSYLLSFIGLNTLTIFALHGMATSIVKGILLFLFGVDLTLLDQNYLLNTILASIIILGLIPACVFINRYTPWFLGKYYNSKKNPY